MNRHEAERHLVGQSVVAAAQGKAVEIQRLRDTCLEREIAAAVGPCPGSG